MLAAWLTRPPGHIATVPPTRVAPREWTATEELQLTTESSLVTLRPAPLWPGATLPDWEGEVWAGAGFLRDRRALGHRDVEIDGIDQARIRRFDWQPAGRGRLLTTLCVGIAEGVGRHAPPAGFTLTSEAPLATEEATMQPDAVLDWVRVLSSER